jgi:hypothetical protein
VRFGNREPGCFERAGSKASAKRLPFLKSIVELEIDALQE